MKPDTKQFTFRTIQAFDAFLGLARERLSAAVSFVDADDLAGAADELRAAATLARQAAEGATLLAGTLDLEVRGVRP